MSRLPEELPAAFGRYRLLKLLGRGGMGAVYLAHDTQLDRRVALKVPHFAADDGPVIRERFYREARAAATVLHPNICALYDVGEIDGVPYLTMAYIEGKPLADVVAVRPLSPRAGAVLVRKVALALHEAHQRGVVHRDLKPANLMIDRRGEPLVMDFGLARRTGGDARLTRTGLALGTPAYMPPEQANCRAEVPGPACDVYSLGVILYELLAGRLPFLGDAMAVVAQVLLDEPPPPSQFRPEIDPTLEAICLRAMAKRKEERYASMTDLAAALEDYLRGSPAAKDRPTARVSSTESGATRSGFRVSRMGGLRSAALAPAPAAERTTQELTPPPSPRLDDAPAPRGRWEWWAAAAGGVVLLVLLGLLVFRITDFGTIQVRLSEADAPVDVKLDYREVTHLGDGIFRLRTGEHDLEVTSKDYDTVHQQFTVRRGPNPPVLVNLQSKYGTCTLELSEPEAKVEIKVDGKPGYRPGDVLHLWPREHQLEVAGADYEPVHQEFSVQRGENPPLHVRLVAKPPAVAEVTPPAKPEEQPPSPRRVAVLNQPFFVIKGHQGPVNLVEFSPVNVETLASAGEDGNVILWLWKRAVPLAPPAHHGGGVLSVAFSPDGSVVATGSRDKTAVLWTGRAKQVLSEHTGAVNAVLFSPDGKFLATASDDGRVLVREPAGKVLRTLVHARPVAALAFSPDGRTLVSGGGFFDEPAEGGEVRAWNPATGALRWSAGGELGGVWGVAFAPDGRTVAGACLDGTVRLWEADTGKELPPLAHEHNARVIGIAYAHGGKTLATASYDRTVRLWDVKTGEAKAILQHPNQVQRLAFSPDDQFLATTCDDGLIRFWTSQQVEERVAK